MNQTVRRLVALVLLAFASAVFAGPSDAAAATPAASSCSAAQLTPADPARVPPPAWLWGGDCWPAFQSCLDACGPSESAPPSTCWLGCECTYCVCAGLECVQECGGGS